MRGVLIVLLLVRSLEVLPSCLIDRTVATWSAPADGGTDAGGTLSRAGWGAYAAQLAVRPCDGGELWVVNATDNLLEGGEAMSDPAQAGATMSLREALYLAVNRPGRDVITFDPALFPDEAPGVIQMTETAEPCFPWAVEDVCIDARDRGVVLQWDSAPAAAQYRLVVGRGSLVVGLQTVGAPQYMGAVGGQIAGVRFATPYRAVQVEAAGVIGPGNAFSAGDIGVETFVWPPGPVPRIVGNFFGRDPVNGDPSTPSRPLLIFDPAIIRDNVFASAPLVAAALVGEGDGGVVAGNTFAGHVDASLGMGWMIGPGNRFESGVTCGVGAQPGSNTLTRNSFLHPEYLQAPGPVASIADASAAGAAGTCPGPGTVELYGNLGPDDSFVSVGEVACADGGTWTVSAPGLPSGSTLRALFTDGPTHGTARFSAPATVP